MYIIPKLFLIAVWYYKHLIVRYCLNFVHYVAFLDLIIYLFCCLFVPLGFFPWVTRTGRRRNFIKKEEKVDC